MMANKFYQLNKNEETAEHLKILNALIETLYKDSDVISMGVGGSFARGDSDRWSDIDIYPLINRLDSTSQSIVTIKKWSKNVGDILFLCTRGLKEGFGIVFQVFFSNLVKVDFNLNDKDSIKPNQLWKYRKILFDKSGLFQSFLNNQRQFWDEEKIYSDFKNQFENLNYSFLIEYTKAYKCLKRNNLWGAIYYLQRLRELIFSGIRFQEKKLAINPSRPQKSVEKDLGDLVKKSEFSNMLTKYSRGSIIRALTCCVDNYEKYFIKKNKVDNQVLRNYNE